MCGEFSMGRNIAILILLILCGVASVEASQANYYFAQNAAGAQDGSSCANAHSVSDFNAAGTWGNGATQIGAGTTAHICGTITGALNATILSIQGSGSAGMPITIKWETGANLTSPACSTQVATGGCININGAKSYIVFDGNCLINGITPGLSGTPCSPASITNTDNGTAIALGGCCHNQNATGAFLVSNVGSCSNCEWKNLTLVKNYVHTPNVGDTNIMGACLNLSGNAWSFHDNYCTDAEVGVLYNYGLSGGTDSGVSIYNNTFDQENHMVEWGASGTSKIQNSSVYNNHFKSAANWDDGSFTFHHDNIIMFPTDCVNNTQTAIKIYNNLFDGDIGVENSAQIFIGCGLRGIYIFNNIFLNPLQRAFSNGQITAGNSGAADNNINIIDNYFDCGGSLGVTTQPTATSVTIANNAITNCSSYWNVVGYTTPPILGGQLDFNAFGADILVGSKMAWDDNGAPYPFPGAMGSATYQGDFMCPPYSGFTGSLVGGNQPCQDGHSIVPAGGFNVSASYIPQMGSPLIKAATNLTATLGGAVPELLFDKAGKTRPATGNWDIGAFQFQGSGALTLVKKTPNSNHLAGTIFPIQMQLVDVNDNPVSGVTVTFAVTRGGGSITPATSTTDSNGLISGVVTLDSKPGLNTFTITGQSAGYVLNVLGF